MTSPSHYIVDADVLPDTYLRVARAKRLLDSGRAATVQDAVRTAGVSRSAYYKYKDAINPLERLADDRMVTFHALLRDEPGVLAGLIGLLARAGANILTINQSIPIHGEASVTATIRMGGMKNSPDTLISRALRMQGVTQFEIISRE